MNKELKDIKSGQGLGSLLFGMSKETVEKMIGKPNEKEINTYSDSLNDRYESWHYDDLELSMSFSEEEDWRLDSIAINSAFYLFNGEPLYGLSILEVQHKLINWELTDIVKEDCSSEENPNHKLLSSDIIGMNFWFDNDRLSEIQWGPLIIDDLTVSWPSLG